MIKPSDITKREYQVKARKRYNPKQGLRHLTKCPHRSPSCPGSFQYPCLCQAILELLCWILATCTVTFLEQKPKHKMPFHLLPSPFLPFLWYSARRTRKRQLSIQFLNIKQFKEPLHCPSLTHPPPISPHPWLLILPFQLVNNVWVLWLF